jgi:hypothetical protein
MKPVGTQSLDQKLKYFAFRHWEKLVFGLAIVCIAGFYWYGRVKPYDKTTPQQLQQKVAEAKQYIQNPDSWVAIADYRKANDEALEVIQNEQPVDHEVYPMGPIRGTKLATRGLRPDPAIKGIIDAQAEVVTGSLYIKRPLDSTGQLQTDFWSELILRKKRAARVAGANETNDEEGDTGASLGRGRRKANPNAGAVDDAAKSITVLPEIMRTEISGISPGKLGLDTDRHSALVVSAVAVTALFPHETELKEYEVFKDRVKYNELRDQPYYVYLQVERRKRVNGQETDWEDITQYVTEHLPKNIYAAETPEIVEDVYFDRYLTMPIPPFVGLNYREFCARPETPAIMEKEVAQPDVMVVRKNQQIGLSDFNRTEEAETAKPAEDKTTKTAQYKLIRFFDLNVGVNEEVQYRMRVWLADPNNPKQEVYARVWDEGRSASMAGAAAGGEDMGSGDFGGVGRGGDRGGGSDKVSTDALDLNPRELTQEVRNRIRELDATTLPAGLPGFLKFCRSTEWSEPTPWISVTSAQGRLVAGRIDTGYQQIVNGVAYYDGEPQADLVVKKWDPALQVPIPVHRKVFRGAVMNFRSPAQVVNPISLEVFDINQDLLDRTNAENGVSFETDAFIVDMLGGDKMPFSTVEKSYYRPSEILVMRGDGRLIVRNELTDRMEYRHGMLAGDELLTDVAPVVKEEEAAAESEGGAAGGRGRR